MTSNSCLCLPQAWRWTVRYMALTSEHKDL